MTVAGITGHIGLTPGTRARVAAEVAARLADLGSPIVGLTSLAGGADQVFGWSVLAAGGSITFVSPCARIEDSMSGDVLAGHRAARGLATSIVELPYELPDEEAYWAAGRYIAEQADVLLAVWDGEPARGLGGTADVVAHRRTLGRPVVVIWPAGAERG